MNRGIAPEDIYSKLIELEGNDEEKAISLVQEFIKGTKKRSWSKSMTELMKKAIEIIINQGQIKPFKEVMAFCRSLTQANYILLYENILKDANEFLLDKYEISAEKYKKFKDKQNVVLEEDMDILEENLVNMKDIIDEQQFFNDQKFIWEAYKTLLDLTKMHSKLFPLYCQILKDCFSFCGENKRIHEFKALCDSIRNYLFMLKKNENKPNFVNKINLSDSKVLRLLIQSSLNQIATANKLEEWEESFKTSEKIIGFIEDYEKIEKPGNKPGKEKKYLKIPPFFEIELYNHIQKLLWVSNYPLYHIYAMISIKKILENNKNKLENLNEKEKQAFNGFNLDNLNERIILAFLSTPLKNAYTNFTKIGEELYEDSNDTEIRTVQKMMKILKTGHIPSRKYLSGYLLNNKIIEKSCKEIKELFYVFEKEKNPIVLAKKGVKYIKNILNEDKYKSYIKNIEENLIIKVLMLMPSIYKNISLSRVINLFKELNLEEYEITDIISESSRINLFKCKIDIRNNLIKFVTNESSQDKFNNIIETFLKSSKKIIKEVIFTKDKQKLEIIKDKLYNEIYSTNKDSLIITNNLLEETKKQNKKLKAYINKRDNLKRDLKIKTAETKEKKIQLMQDKEQLEKDKLRSEQEQRELEAEMKRYLIDSLRKFTNSIVLKDGKRIKLDDLLKDLNKVTSEELIKHYDEQKIESASKKEKELKKDTKIKDYILRELRKRDMDNYEKEIKKDMENAEKKRKEELEKELQKRDEVLKYKPFKDSYCIEIEKKNLEEYKSQIEQYNKYLKERVTQDVFNELDSFFDKYFEDFTNKQMAENQQKRAFDIWTQFDINRKKVDTLERGSQFQDVKTEKKVVKDFQRSARAEENKEADKMKNQDKEFERSKKFEDDKKKNQDKEFERSKKFEEKNKMKNQKNEFERSKKFEEKKKEDKSWRKGESTEDNKDKKESWRKGDEPKKENKKHNETKKEDKKEDSWRRGDETKKEENWRGGNEPKKEDKKHETKKNDNWRRGDEPKKEDKKAETKKDDNNWRRGGEEPKKENKKTESKKEDNWRRGEEPKKEDKKEDKKKEKKTETKKEDSWRRGEEPKKEEKKTETKKEENWRKPEEPKKKKKKKK